jgi:galactokinase/mevalonate kinase-like predicted kinase
MIISRTPLRISFVGGGSDLPAFYHQEGGAVVSTTINKYIYITVNPKFDDKIRASHSRTEIVDHVDELRHELIREALKLASGITKPCIDEWYERARAHGAIGGKIMEGRGRWVSAALRATGAAPRDLRSSARTAPYRLLFQSARE